MATCRECETQNEMTLCQRCIHGEICGERDWYDEDDERSKTYCAYFLDKSDYVKRERGEWKKHKSNPKVMDELHKLGIGKAMNRNSIFWTCSCCGSWGTPAHKFCPNCGADMRKEDT